MSASIEYTYFLQPAGIGSYTIGPAEVAVDGKTYRSHTVNLSVVKSEPVAGGGEKAVFLQASLASEEIYIAEKTVLTLKLYHAVRVGDVSLDFPKSDRLTIKQMGRPTEYQRRMGNRTYGVLEVRYVVSSEREGSYPIGPIKMKMMVFEPGSRSNRGFFRNPFFDDPFFAQGRPLTVAGEMRELKILSLPEKNRPADFTGLVGTFTIESSLAPTTIRSGESATLTVRITGHGNTNRIPDLKIPALDHVKVYADQPTFETGPAQGGETVTKIQKWALLPDQPGTVRLPVLRLSYFDTKEREYKRLETLPPAVTVLPNEKKDTPSMKARDQKIPAVTTKEEVKELGRDILPIHTGIRELTTPRRSKAWEGILAAVLSVPAGLYIAVCILLWFRGSSKKNRSALRAKKALGSFIRGCKESDNTYNDLNRLVRDYLNHRFMVNIGTLTPKEAVDILKKNGFDKETIKAFEKRLNVLENAVYTGMGDEQAAISKDLSDIIEKIDKGGR
jgi:hypothetical protein